MTFQQLAKKLLADQQFRAAIMKNPKAALKKAGVDATPEQIKALEGVNWNQLATVAAAFSKGIGPDTVTLT
jgi:hypothetical protein